MHYYEARKLTSIKGFDQGCKPWVFLQPLSILGFDNCIDERIGGPERRGSCTRGPQMLEISQKNILCRNIFLETWLDSKERMEEIKESRAGVQ